MKKIALLLILLISINLFAQKNDSYSFGKVTDEEINLKKYKLDTTANAVVLLDIGSTVFLKKGGYAIISSKYYQKIKLFNKEGFKHATFNILTSNNLETMNIKAVTHNNSEKTYLNSSQIYEKKISGNLKEYKFTLPNLKEGSIIEVEYTLEKSNIYSLPSWYFQVDIPVKFSQYTSSIPGNYIYNRSLGGYLKLKTNTATVKKNCFIISSFERAASCEVLTYSMENIPAFIEEDYMTDKDNFISKIKFELAEIKEITGTKNKFTKTWKSVDRKLKINKSIGLQFKKDNFFKDKLPTQIINLETDLEKAKAIYTFIQKHYTWNKRYGIFDDVHIKKAFESKVGNISEINFSLIHALKIAGLQPEIVLISTRNNGFPTKLHPIISDFNYLIAKVTIENRTYLLDATDKLIPFGLLPFRCLNNYGRAMDFKKDSYWIDIIPDKNTKTQLSISLKLQEDGTITGKLRKAYFAHSALNRRREIENMRENDLILDFENGFDNLEIVSYKIENKENIDKPLIEIFEILIEDDNSSSIYLNPFFGERFTVNPFKQKNRLYPVDFGYPRKYIVNLSFEIPSNYIIKSFPESKSIALPKNGGKFFYFIKKYDESKITLSSSIKINKSIFYNNEYPFLKEFFKIIINSQKTPIALKKT